MRAVKPRRLLVIALAGTACTAHPSTEPARIDTTPLAAETVPSAPVTPSPELARPQPPAPTPAPAPLPARGTIDDPAPGIAKWEERPGLSEIQGFHPLVMGVLAECGPDGGKWCELGRDDRLTPSKMLTPDEQDIVGIWPSDAWRVEREEGEAEMEDPSGLYAMWVFVDFQRWNTKRFARKKRIEVELDAHSEMAGNPSAVSRKGWAGGMLLLDGFLVHHIPATTGPVKLSGDVWDVFEAESGRMLLVVHHGNHRLTVEPHCPGKSCVGGPVLELQGETRSPDPWDFPLDVPRGGDSLTIVAEHDAGPYLLHYDAPAKGASATFHREEVPVRVSTSMLWPDAHGGLWLETDDALAYRDASGRWLEVTPPTGTPIGCANRLEPRELLVVVRDASGATRVYATSGPALPSTTAEDAR